MNIAMSSRYNDYKLKDIVEMKKQHPCRKSKYWEIIRMGADIKIKCEGCGAVVMFSRPRFEANVKEVLSSRKLIEINEKNRYKKDTNFISLENEPNRLVKQIKIYKNMIDIISENDLIFNLQLVEGSNNHVTKLHNIENRVVNISYRAENNQYKLFSYKCHYCLNCHNYFDFYHSFTVQIEKHGIDISKLIIKITKTYGEESFSKEWDKQSIFAKFSDESLLHVMGYRVGRNGISSVDRKKLVDSLLEEKVMTVLEIKSTLNNNIRMFSGRTGYELAVKEWKEDIDYLNKKIK